MHFSCRKCTCLKFLVYLCTRKSGFSAVGSALRSGRRGRWFESSNPDSKRLEGDAFQPLFCLVRHRFATFYNQFSKRIHNALTLNELQKAFCSAKDGLSNGERRHQNAKAANNRRKQPQENWHAEFIVSCMGKCFKIRIFVKNGHQHNGSVTGPASCGLL